MFLVSLIIPWESFLVFSTSSTLYDLSGGLGASCYGGVLDGVSLSIALSSGVDAGVKV